MFGHRDLRVVAASPAQLFGHSEAVGYSVLLLGGVGLRLHHHCLFEALSGIKVEGGVGGEEDGVLRCDLVFEGDLGGRHFTAFEAKERTHRGGAGSLAGRVGVGRARGEGAAAVKLEVCLSTGLRREEKRERGAKWTFARA